MRERKDERWRNFLVLFYVFDNLRDGNCKVFVVMLYSVQNYVIKNLEYFVYDLKKFNFVNY